MFKIINEIQKEQNQVQLSVKSILRDAPRPSQRRKECEQVERELKDFFTRHWPINNFFKM